MVYALATRTQPDEVLGSRGRIWDGLGFRLLGHSGLRARHVSMSLLVETSLKGLTSLKRTDHGKPNGLHSHNSDNPGEDYRAWSAGLKGLGI